MRGFLSSVKVSTKHPYLSDLTSDLCLTTSHVNISGFQVIQLNNILNFSITTFIQTFLVLLGT